METYRLSSKLRKNEREYLIQTSNNPSTGSIATLVYADGSCTETTEVPHPADINDEELLLLVESAHGQKKQELEVLFGAYQKVDEVGDPEFMGLLGAAFFYKRLHHEAHDLFLRVTEISTDNHAAQNFLCMVYRELGQSDKAVIAGRAAVAGKPEYADYRNNLGEAYLADNSPQAAVTELEQALAINMYYGDAYLNLAMAGVLQMSHAANQKEARQLTDKVLECLDKTGLIYPHIKNHLDFREGLKAHEAGEYGRALTRFSSLRESLRESHRLESAEIHMRFVLHPECVSVEKVASRIRFLENQLQDNPGFLDLQSELARCYLEHARLLWDKGVEKFASLEREHPAIAPGLGISDELSSVRQSLEAVAERLVEKE